ncbi:leukocyte receptor cluster member 1 homolog [Harmonia axyridis]|uniref:leukocyte receptor cluster member 1 homolog n=1 Tax=Harmonia axyridis TaxID=115357 RepID=UPI001E2764EF|nr:leukocyte receptor cluster member 1 homolog [Harmonia axyridis]
MNILPKKRWHVRTKDNIARVRRDEARAEEERNEKEERQKFAEREARTQFLRDRARERVGLKDFIPLSSKSEQPQSDGHINLFEELEDGQEESKRTNKEHEKEKKEETEKYEKQIGYLTYLGQDTNEALGKRDWYDEIPIRDSFDKDEVNIKSKLKEDPLEIMKKYIPSSFKEKKTSGYIFPTKSDITIEYPLKSEREHREKDLKNKKRSFKSKSHKHKKRRRNKYDSDSNESENEKTHKKFNVSDSSDVSKKKKLDLLRAERLNRERQERHRTDLLLNEMKSISNCSETIQRKYNSQFNPNIARQNQYN